MNGQGDFAATLTGWAHEAAEIALGWLSSPAAWSQFGLLAVAYLVARIATARAMPFVTRLLDPAAKVGPLASARRFALRFVPLMLPLVAYGLTALGEEVTRATFGSGEVIAFGKRVFIFLAARIFVREVLTDSFLRLLGKYVLIPVAALSVLGVLDDITQRLDETVIALGNIRFSVLALIRGVIAGAVLSSVWSVIGGKPR